MADGRGGAGWRRRVAFCLPLLLWLGGCTQPAPPPLVMEASEVGDTEEMGSPALYAQQWMQTSAEYTALCLQTYNTARRRVAAHLRDPGAAATGDRRRPAVILDLDETVIDNGPYRTWQLRSGKPFTPRSWKRWVWDGALQARLVPGAKWFIEEMERLGVTVVYLSNRTDSSTSRLGTIMTLEHLGLNITGLKERKNLRLLLRQEQGAGKELRRRRVRERYRVLALLGDNLGDFSSLFEVGPRTTVDSRRHQVLAHREDWGDIWFVLPNPFYGAWRRLIPIDDPLYGMPEWQDSTHSPK